MWEESRGWFRVAVVAAGLVVGSASAAACRFSEPRTVSLRMRGGVPDATVVIDDVHIGALALVAQRGVALPPGTHLITVERDGYFPWDRVVVVDEGDPPVHFDVVLTPIPD